LLADGHTVVFLYGAATGEDLALARDLGQEDLELSLATEDGSTGHHGDVLSLLAELQPDLRDRMDAPWVATCGPWEMMRRVAERFEGWASHVQVSVEARMACGVGACLGCAVGRAKGGGYAYACTDGPVFDAAAVEWGQPPL
jgi:dihydroorotate dehydrogenase electron transfer subunit